MNTTEIYKIRSKKTGLFSKGGCEPDFNKIGKVWKQRGHVTSHLGQLTSRGQRIYQQEEVEIVQYSIVESDVISYPDWLSGILDRKLSIEQARQQRFDEAQKKDRMTLYFKLKKEFG